jgi:succinylarginine dihydrolase
LVEVQFDGLPGPTHHYGGLSAGNVASASHAGQMSRPRAAALQCLEKMATVLALGVPVCLLPPLARPDLGFLAACGFTGDPRGALLMAEAESPELVRWAQSSAAMWTANAATVAPGADGDGITRLVPANLVATAHRALEAAPRTAMLRALLGRVPRLEVEEAVPPLAHLGDEGAANHTRLTAGAHGLPGVHLFVHGRALGMEAARLPRRFPARQTLEASRAVARLLRLPAARCLHARQHPDAIDAGAFHNDVVMVGDRERLLLHERALVEQPRVLAQLRALVPGLRVHEVAEADLPLDAAVRSYLFNSQLLSTPAGTVLVAPQHCGEGPAAAAIRRLADEGFIARAVLVDLQQSMANGGGPACLRLRVPLDAAQRAALPPGIVLDAARIAALKVWVEGHYRESLAAEDIADPRLIDEGRAALAALTTLLGLPPLYRFQGGPC